MTDSVPSHRDALDVFGFQRLYAGACNIDNPQHRFLACFIILMMGRLGLRIAELQHLREEWIDWERGVIRIPERDPCACQRCWLQAYDEWGRNGLRELKDRDDFNWDGPRNWKNCSSELRKEIIEAADCCTPESLKAIVVEDQFGAKYEQSARTIPFGWSERLTCVLMTFFDRHDALDYSQHWINDILTMAAENAEGIDEEDLSAHNLRATGLTFLADNSVDAKMLRDLAGWEDLQTAVKYLRQSGRILTHKMYHIMGSHDDAPPVVPGEPEEMFPVVKNPTPFQGEPVDPIGPGGKTYDADCRRERAREQRSDKLRVRHYREVSIPEGRAGFPTEPELDFNVTDLGVPGHIDPDSDLYDAQSGEVVSKATTLAQYTGSHTVANPREFEDRKWRKDTVQQTADSYGEDSAHASTPALGIVQSVTVNAGVLKSRLEKEWRWAISGDGSPRPTREHLTAAVGSVAMLGFTALTMASQGVYVDPIAWEVSAPTIPTAGMMMGSTIGTANVLWTDYCVREADREPYPRLASIIETVREKKPALPESITERLS